MVSPVSMQLASGMGWFTAWDDLRDVGFGLEARA